MTHWFPDNSVIVNFGRIDRLDLLKSYLRDRARVTQAVSREITDSTNIVPAMQFLDQQEWFGDPIRVVGDVGRVEGIRRHVFGGSRNEPRKHLGESETLYIIQFDTEYSDSVWITEDKSAYDFAKKNSIITRNTFEVFKELCAFGELTKEAAFDLMESLFQMERLFYCPRSSREFDE